MKTNKPNVNLNVNETIGADNFLAEITKPVDATNSDYVSAINVFITSTTLGQGCAGAFDFNKGSSVTEMVIEPPQNYKVQPVTYRRQVNAEKLKSLAVMGDNTKASNYLLALDRESERVACLDLLVRELKFLSKYDKCNSVIIVYVNKCLFNELAYGKHKFYMYDRAELTEDSYYGKFEIDLWEKAHKLIALLDGRLVFRQFENLKAEKSTNDSEATALRKSIHAAMYSKLLQAYKEESSRRRNAGIQTQTDDQTQSIENLF